MKRTPLRTLLSGGVVSGLLLAGCGSSKSYVVTGDANAPGPAFTIHHSAGQVLARDGDLVDSVELEAFDADGNLLLFESAVLGKTALEEADDAESPVRPFSGQVSFPPLPAGTASVEIDYMRNGGFTLFQSKVDVAESQSSVLGIAFRPSSLRARSGVSPMRMESSWSNSRKRYPARSLARKISRSRASAILPRLLTFRETALRVSGTSSSTRRSTRVE